MLMRLRQVITHNWILKLFSLLLATLMWFAIWSGSNDQMSRTVNLVFRNIPENMEITGQTDIPVTLQLRGSFDLLAGLSSTDITPTISLAGQEPGHKSFQISQDNIDTPPGVEVFGVTPDRIEFDLERTIRKEVDIQAFVEGDPEEGYIIDDVQVTPAQMTIEGPESRIAPIESLSTVPVRVDGRSQSLSTPVNLNLPDSMVRLESFAPVDVSVEIVEVSAEAIFEIQADPSLADVWNLSTDTLEVTLRGPTSEIERFGPEGAYFRFDPASVGENGEVVPDIVGLPDSLTVMELRPEGLVVSRIR